MSPVRLRSGVAKRRPAGLSPPAASGLGVSDGLGSDGEEEQHLSARNASPEDKAHSSKHVGNVDPNISGELDPS